MLIRHGSNALAASMRIAEDELAVLGTGQVRSCHCPAKAGVSHAWGVAVGCTPERPNSASLFSALKQEHTFYSGAIWSYLCALRKMAKLHINRKSGGTEKAFLHS